MVRITNPEPPAKVDAPEIALSGSDFAHLHRALLWLLILFSGSAATSLAINLPTPLFAGMQCYLAWCAIAALIQYFFLRIEGSALSGDDPDRSLTARRGHKPNNAERKDRSIVSGPSLSTFARTWQWVIFFTGVTATALCIRETIGT